MARIGVEPNHPPARPHAISEEVERPAGTAAQIDGAFPWLQLDLVE
jgi:hypothetical protein